eukprot:3854843-Rhodomonas_salina.1
MGRQRHERESEPGLLQGHQPLLLNNRQNKNPATYGEELRAQMEEEQRKKATERRQDDGGSQQGLL